MPKKKPYIYHPIIVINKKKDKISPFSIDNTANQLENSCENISYCLYKKKLPIRQKPLKFDDLKGFGKRAISITQSDELLELLDRLPNY